jgi:hypothetical protein
MPEPVIVDAVRTPIGRAFKGSLAQLRPDEMGAFVVDALLERNPEVDPDSIEELYCGVGLPQGLQGFNLARIMVLLSEKLPTGGACASGDGASASGRGGPSTPLACSKSKTLRARFRPSSARSRTAGRPSGASCRGWSARATGARGASRRRCARRSSPGARDASRATASARQAGRPTACPLSACTAPTSRSHPAACSSTRSTPRPRASGDHVVGPLLALERAAGRVGLCLVVARHGGRRNG